MSLKIEELNGKRSVLADKLPLKQPYSISVTTANVCNLACEYCAISEKGRARNKPFLEFDTFQKLVDSLEQCNWHLKQIVLVGLGEPLLNSNLPDFVKYVKEKKVADKVHIVTNGTLFNKEISDRLIAVGTDVIRISINGLSDEDYEKYTGRKIDFESVLKELRYYYENKRDDSKVYIKIMDYMVDSEEKKNRFNKLFGSISDVTNIEYLTQMSTTLDYDKVAHLDDSHGLKGFRSTDVKVCPLPFYHAYFNAEGTFSACCVAGPWYSPPALQMGNIYNNSIDEIWNGEKYTAFFEKMLAYGREKADPICKACQAYSSYVYPEDNIDDSAEAILERMKSGRRS